MPLNKKRALGGRAPQLERKNQGCLTICKRAQLGRSEL
jgi:hypothetical protein